MLVQQSHRLRRWASDPDCPVPRAPPGTENSPSPAVLRNSSLPRWRPEGSGPRSLRPVYGPGRRPAYSEAEPATASGAEMDISAGISPFRSEEHTSELQSRENLVCRLLLEKKKIKA